MAKKKDSRALFEVIAGGKPKEGESDMGVPEWASGRPAPAPGTALGETAGADRETRVDPPVVDTSSGRLVVSLNYVSCLVIAMGVLVLALAAFWLGRATAPDGKDPAVDGPRIPAGTGPGVQGRQTVSFKREPGKQYLVIQWLNGATEANLREATRIRSYCWAEGVRADIFENKERPAYYVWSRKGFDSGKSKEAEQYKREIEAMGKEYFDKHRTHKFSDPYYKSMPKSKPKPKQ